MVTNRERKSLAEIRRSSKISSWIWSIISGVGIVLGRPGRGVSQVEKSHLNWTTQYLTVTYNGACSLNISVRMSWISFGDLPCRGKKNLMTAHVCMLLKSRASPDMPPFSLCNKKRLAIRHINRTLFPTTLSIPSYIGKYVGLRTYQHPLVGTQGCINNFRHILSSKEIPLTPLLTHRHKWGQTQKAVRLALYQNRAQQSIISRCSK